MLSRAYLTEKFKSGKIDLSVRDPYCILDAERSNSERLTIGNIEMFQQPGIVLVHRDYLCTLIAKPK